MQWVDDNGFGDEHFSHFSFFILIHQKTKPPQSDDMQGHDMCFKAKRASKLCAAIYI